MNAIKLTSFDDFKPRLMPGQILPQGSHLVYETVKKNKQIILPLEMADLLILSSGKYSMKEILEKIYERQNHIYFKSIYHTLYNLKERQLLENGHELEPDKITHSTSQSSFFSLFKPLIEIFFGQKISNDNTHSILFYISSLILITFSLLGLQNMNFDKLFTKLLRVNGSYVQGIGFFLLFSSCFLSWKTLCKSVLYIFATGKVYNFRLIFSALGLFFKVGNESLTLMSNKLHLSLLMLTLSLSYFFPLFVLHFVMPGSEIYFQSTIISLFLTLVDLNPLNNQSDLSAFMRMIYDDDGFNQFAAYFKKRDISHFVANDLEKKEKHYIYIQKVLALAWSILVLLFIWNLSQANYNLILYSINHEPFKEKIVSMGIILFFSLIVFSISQTLMNFLMTSLQNIFHSQIHKIINLFKVTDESNYSKEKILSTLNELPLFSYLNQDLLMQVINGSKLRKFPAHCHVIRQGDVGNHLFILFSGSLSIKRVKEDRWEHIGEILPPSIFGEIAVIEDVRRTSSVLTDEPSTILEIPASLMREATYKSQNVREIEDFKKAIIVSQFFHSAPIFKDLPPELIQLFLNQGKIETISPKDVIVRQGDKEEGFFLLIRGSVGVYINKFLVKKIRQGGFFGEITMMTDVPRTASVVALEEVLLLKISKKSFWSILCQNIELALYVEAVGESRIEEDLKTHHYQDKIKSLSPDQAA